MNKYEILLDAILDAKAKGDIQAQLKNMKDLSATISKLNLNPSAITDIKKRLLSNGIDITLVFNNANQLQNQAKQIGQQAEQLISKKLNSIQLSIDTEKYSSELFQIQQQLSKFGTQSGEVFTKASASIQMASSAYHSMLSTSGDERIKKEEEYQKHLSTSKNLLAQIESAKSNELIVSSDSRRITFINTLNDYLAKNTAISKENKLVITDWISTLSSVDDMTSGSIETMKAQFDSLNVKLRDSGELGLSWKDKMIKMWDSFGGKKITSNIISLLTNQMKKIPQEVYEIDTAMTSLYEVTDETDAKYNQFLTSTIQSAKELGHSVTTLIGLTSTWAKLGFSLEDSRELSKTSSIYSNIGAVDNETAISDIAAAMKAFNITASDSIKIIDIYNKLGDQFSVTSADIGEGVRNSASALALQGNSIEQVAAMIAGGGEKTQNAGELGHVLEVASLRLASMKDKLQELNEEYDNIGSISNNQASIYDITKGQVNIIDQQNGKLKNTYTILKEVAAAWDTIELSQQNALLELIFGEQKTKQGTAVVEAFQSGQVDAAYQTALNADGSAMQEQERWMDSLQAKVQQFEATFQSLSNTVLDSDLLKFFVDLGTTGVNSINELVKSFTPLEALLTVGGGILGANGLGLT